MVYHIAYSLFNGITSGAVQETNVSTLNDLIHRVAKATQAPQAGVVICTRGNGVDGDFVIWAIGTNGRITSHELCISCTDEARLQAHVEGFIENHVKAFGGWVVQRVGTKQRLDKHFCIWSDVTDHTDTWPTKQAAKVYAEGNAPQEDAFEVVPFTKVS